MGGSWDRDGHEAPAHKPAQFVKKKERKVCVQPWTGLVATWFKSRGAAPLPSDQLWVGFLVQPSYLILHRYVFPRIHEFVGRDGLIRYFDRHAGWDMTGGRPIAPHFPLLKCLDGILSTEGGSVIGFDW